MIVRFENASCTFDSNKITFFMRVVLYDEDGEILRKEAFSVDEDLDSAGWQVRLVSKLTSLAQGVIDDYKNQLSRVTSGFTGAQKLEDVLRAVIDSVQKGLKV